MTRARIFISYRRTDAAGHVGWLYEILKKRFEQHDIFRDIESIEFGEDFVEAIQEGINKCHIVLVVIGRQWLTVTDMMGLRRLDNPHDYVRLEVATALQRGIRTIPVIVQDAEIPRSDHLPDDLKPLSRRNACFLRDTSWEDDVNRLATAINKMIPTIIQQCNTSPDVQQRDACSNEGGAAMSEGSHTENEKPSSKQK